MTVSFLICQRVWKTAKCQGKIREKSGNFEVDKWQPCSFVEIYMVLDFQKIQVEFEKEGYASIWPGVLAPDKHEKLQIFHFCSVS